LACDGAAVFVTSGVVSEKPWRIESTLLLVLRILTCLVIGVVLDSLLRHLVGAKRADAWNLHVLIATLTLQGMGMVWIALFLRDHHTGWAEAFGFGNRWPQALGLGVMVAVVVVPGTLIIHYACINLMELMHLEVDEQLPVQFLREAHSLGKVLYLGFATILLAPVAEEMLFRGILYPQIKNLGYPRLALWSVAVLFALIHVNLAAFLPLVFLALMLTMLYEWTNNLLACIVVHSLFNAANFAALFLVKSTGP
jgi:membrane protease YdiL (CAAX protease family)